MKRLFLLILTVLLLLTGCAQAGLQEIYTVERDGILFNVEPEAHTISDGKNIYIYKVTENSTLTRMVATLPGPTMNTVVQQESGTR